MSTCPTCGAWSPDDPETGVFDDICPSCKEDGFTITADGEIIREREGEEEPVTEFDSVRRG